MRSFIAFLWICLVAVAINSPIGDPDLWWHITVGRWILAHQEIPTTDLWNAFSNPATEWRAYSWIHEALYAFIDRAYGVRGLWWAQYALAVIFVGGITIAFARLARDSFIGLLIATLVAVACYQNFSLRPQTLAWLLLVWSIVAADALSRREHTVRSLLFMVVLFAIWANSHITTILGLFAVICWSAASGRVGTIVLASGAAFLGTLITPYWGGEWLTFFSKTDHPLSLVSIAEFQPATVLQYGLGVIAIMIGLVVAFLAAGGRGLSPGALLVALLFSAAGAAIVKFIPFGAVSLGALLAVIWRNRGSIMTPSNGIIEGIQRLRAAINWLPQSGLAFLLFALVIVNLSNKQRYPLHTELVPQRAVDFIMSENLPAPLLSDFGRGGYLMYRFSNEKGELPGDRKVVIDGRTNVNSPQIWNASRKAVTGAAGWDEILAIVNPQTILWRRESPFVQLLLATREWREVFRSGSEQRGYVVLVRTVPSAAPAVAEPVSQSAG